MLIQYTCPKCGKEVTVSIDTGPITFSKSFGGPRKTESHVVTCPLCGARHTVEVPARG